jgi:type I restriction enzyme R subunit
MWLTGFDAPSLHTLYIDKPMKGHNLMQAIARVNRVYKFLSLHRFAQVLWNQT